MELTNNMAIILKNATTSSLKKSARSTDIFSTDIPGVNLYVPGSIVPIICKDGCPMYGKIKSVSLTETTTTVGFEAVDVSSDIADATYKLYQMLGGKSIVGSYQSKSGGKGRYSLGDLPRETRNFFGFDDED